MWWTVVKEAATNWSIHKDARQGAALAYYSVFSLGPIIVIAIAVAGLLFGRDAVSSQLMSSTDEMRGDTGAKAVEAMLAGASRPAAGILATIFGIGALLFAAIGPPSASWYSSRTRSMWSRRSKNRKSRTKLHAIVRRGADAGLSFVSLAGRERRPGGSRCPSHPGPVRRPGSYDGDKKLAKRFLGSRGGKKFLAPDGDACRRLTNMDPRAGRSASDSLPEP